MAKSYNQKAKILYLAKMLRESGENRVLSMQDILFQLMEYGIKAERKSIYDDIETLRNFGMDVKFKRGRAGGYYLSGQQAENPGNAEAEAADKPSRDSQEDGQEKWRFAREDGGAGEKPLRLLCSSSVKEKVQEYFGGKGEYKEKGQGYFSVTVSQSGNAQFFGWLTAMGKEVHIVKPKKTAQAYREYLKSLARDYKGI